SHLGSWRPPAFFAARPGSPPAASAMSTVMTVPDGVPAPSAMSPPSQPLIAGNLQPHPLTRRGPWPEGSLVLVADPADSRVRPVLGPDRYSWCAPVVGAPGPFPPFLVAATPWPRPTCQGSRSDRAAVALTRRSRPRSCDSEEGGL